MRWPTAAVTLETVECLGVRVSECTDGETVAKALREIFATAGAPVAVIKDGGGELSKGVALWKERAGKSAVWTIDDLGHVLANALKAQFDTTRAFQRFVAIIHRGAARLRQTPLAFLMPPKLRTQGRFQGVTRLGQWAEKIFKALAGSGCAQDDGLRAKLRSAMTGLASLRPFIRALGVDCAPRGPGLGDPQKPSSPSGYRIGNAANWLSNCRRAARSKSDC